MDTITRARQEIAQMKARIQELETYIRVHSSLISDDPELSALLDDAMSASRKRDMQAKQRIGDAAEEILIAQSPLSAEEITRQIQASGVEINAQRPVQYVTQILSRSKERFVGKRGVGWRLVQKNEAEDGRTSSASSQSLNLL